MPTVVVDVDTQFDFVNPAGALHVPVAAETWPAITARLREAVALKQPIIGSVDSHAYDSWEFAGNGGPFSAHCVKGTRGWLKVANDIPARTRFIPMQVADRAVRNLVGEAERGEGRRELNASGLAAEAAHGIGIFFEKEVYSLFSNPACEHVVAALVAQLGGPASVTFDVLGYCTGGYCVDAAVTGLLDRGYAVRVLGNATAAIGGDAGAAMSRETLVAAGAEWVGIS